MASLSLLVLAGGRSRRLAQDKAWIPIAGKPLIERAVERVIEACEEPFAELLVALAHPEAGGREAFSWNLPHAYRLVRDALPDAGPFAGIVAGLEAARTPWLFVTSCDRPEAEPALVSYLLERSRSEAAPLAVLPCSSTGPEPLFGLYHRDLAVEARRYLDRGGRAVVDFMRNVRMLWIPAAETRRLDPEERSFLNLNTPRDVEDYRRRSGGESNSDPA